MTTYVIMTWLLAMLIIIALAATIKIEKIDKEEMLKKLEDKT
jgi:hypothetical protein